MMKPSVFNSLAWLVVFLFASACSKPEDKPVTDPLTTEDVNDIVARDERAAEWIKDVSARYIRNERKFGEYADLTYSRYFDFKARQAENGPRWSEEARREYAREYEQVFVRADSVFQYWKQWEIDHRLPQRVQVTPVNIRRDADGSIYVSFRIHSTIGELQGVSLRFRISDMVDNTTYGINLPDIKGEVLSGFFSDAEIRDLKIYPTVWTPDEQKLLRLKNDAPTGAVDHILSDINALNIGDFMAKYGFSIEPTEISIGGRTVWSFSHKYDMPEAIRHFWIPSAKPAHDGVARFEDMKNVIIRQMLKLDIPTEDEFVYEYVSGKERLIDERAYEFDHMPYDIAI